MTESDIIPFPSALRRRGGPSAHLRDRILARAAREDAPPWTAILIAASVALLLNTFIRPGTSLMPERAASLSRIIAERAAVLEP